MSIFTRSGSLNVRPLSGKVFFTIHDLEGLPEYPEGPLLELLHGDLYMVPSPTTLHQDISRKLTVILGNFLNDTGIGKLYVAPIDVILSEEDLVIPDLLIVLNENKDIIKEKNIQGVPDVVFEILSSNRSQDLERKKDIYEKYGVKEYFVIDPIEKIVYYFLHNGLKFKTPQVISGEDKISSLSLGGLDVTINEIFN